MLVSAVAGLGAVGFLARAWYLQNTKLDYEPRIDMRGCAIAGLLCGIVSFATSDTAASNSAAAQREREASRRRIVPAAPADPYALAYSPRRTERLGVQALRDSLKDGDGARVRNVSTYSTTKGGGVACGEVNAQNSFGAYMGYRRFLASENGNVVMLEGPADEQRGFNLVWNRFCR